MCTLHCIEKFDALSEITIPNLMEVMQKVDIRSEWLEETLPAELPGDTYLRHVLHKGDNYEVILAAWPVGTQTLPHDHGNPSSIGVVRVLKGTMFNRIYRREPAGHLEPVHEEEIKAGDISKVTPGLVHTMGNACDQEISLSLHVYSPLMINVSYWEADTLLPAETLLQN